MTTTIPVIDFPDSARSEDFLGSPVHIKSWTKRKVWEPYMLNCKDAADAFGQDTFQNFISNNATLYYSEPQAFSGRKLTVCVQPSAQNAGTINPLFAFRIYGNTEWDAYNAVEVYSKTWTNLAAGSTPAAILFTVENPASTTVPEPRGASFSAFDFYVRGATSAEVAAIVPASAPVILLSWTVRIIGEE